MYCNSIDCLSIGPDGERHRQSLPLAAEHFFTAHLPDGSRLSFSCTDGDLPELLLGRLISEGRLPLHRDGLSAAPVLPQGSEVWVEFPCGPADAIPLAPLPPVKPDLEEILAANQLLKKGFEGYERTHSLHSCQLWSEGKRIRVFEDLGRHNAVDKAIGYLALHGLEPASCMLFVSSRISAEIAEKLIRGRIPVLASKGLPTAQAALLSRRYGLKLFHCQREGGLLQFS